jgi:two-component system, chemotaxis family, chemotaxis protein CheY
VIPSLLIVDGDPDTRLLYRTALEPVIGSVVEAEDGAEALGVALCCHPSVVITEMRLQRVDGCELCSMLRAVPALRFAAIVVVTADARPAEAARATDAGADEVLIKPCNVEAIVEAALRSWQRRQSAATKSTGDGETMQRPATKVRQRERYVTAQPPSQPPQLRCPLCDRVLQYYRSHVGGVSDVHPEQWDYYVCAGRCGTFQYRQRTRTVRRVAHLADGEWESDAQPRGA